MKLSHYARIADFPDLASKNTECPVKLDCQINKVFTRSISHEILGTYLC